jgi:hypothetical protein
LGDLKNFRDVRVEKSGNPGLKAWLVHIFQEGEIFLNEQIPPSGMRTGFA